MLTVLIWMEIEAPPPRLAYVSISTPPHYTEQLPVSGVLEHPFEYRWTVYFKI